MNHRGPTSFFETSSLQHFVSDEVFNVERVECALLPAPKCWQLTSPMN